MWFNNLAQTKCSNGNSNFLEFSRNYNSKHKTERSFSPLHQHDRKFFFDVYVYISALVTKKMVNILKTVLMKKAYRALGHHSKHQGSLLRMIYVGNTGNWAQCVDWAKDEPQMLLLDEISDNQLVSYCFPVSSENSMNTKKCNVTWLDSNWLSFHSICL